MITWRRLLWMRFDHWTYTWYARNDLNPDEVELMFASRLGSVWLPPIAMKRP
jgi:hypothetical protein